jgi:hypothetical protein
MAIATIDDIIAGWTDSCHFFLKTMTSTVGGSSSWFWAGIPGIGAAVSSGVTGTALSSTSGLIAGQIPFYDPTGGQNAYLGRLTVSPSPAALILFCDRLWSNSGVLTNTTGSQTINSVTWPARDADGSTDGRGVLIGLEHSVTSGSGNAPTATITYTNSAGVGSRTGTVTINSAASISRFVTFSLQGDDVGVRSIQSFQLSATVGGTLHLVAYRPIQDVMGAGSYSVTAIDPLNGGLPRLYNGSVPFLVISWVTTGGGSGTIFGTVQYLWGS